MSRKSSAPGCTIAPIVALRAETMPSSGATMRVFDRRSSCACRRARCASTRARAVCAAVRYCSICCALIAPLRSSRCARSALAFASASVASASASAARICARSACTVSADRRASSWPRRTRSPTLTRTSASCKPLTSLPTTISCQAATLPLAATVTGHDSSRGAAVVTVSAGRAAPDALDALPAVGDATRATPLAAASSRPRAASAASSRPRAASVARSSPGEEVQASTPARTAIATAMPPRIVFVLFVIRSFFLLRHRPAAAYRLV